jgi:hypothetical protein
MTQLTYLLRAEVRDSKSELNGKILTRPSLLITDGTVVIYACDVDIGVKDPSGNDQVEDLIDKYNTVLRNVPIARSDYELIYADVGSAVRLRRTTSGQYEIVGFSDEMPGTYVRVPVDIENLTIGAIQEISITSRPLTLIELSTFGVFGEMPFGSIAIFQGATLLRIQV